MGLCSAHKWQSIRGKTMLADNIYMIYDTYVARSRQSMYYILHYVKLLCGVGICSAHKRRSIRGKTKPASNIYTVQITYIMEAKLLIYLYHASIQITVRCGDLFRI